MQHSRHPVGGSRWILCERQGNISAKYVPFSFADMDYTEIDHGLPCLMADEIGGTYRR